MSVLIKGVSGTDADVDATPKAVRGILYDAAGNPIPKIKNATYAPASHGVMPIGGVNDSTFRPVRTDRFGGLASAKASPIIAYHLYSANLPPAWLTTASTMTITHATASGTLLNANNTTTNTTNAILYSMRSALKLQKSPLQSRHRARLVKGGSNAVADWGLSSTTNALGSAVPTNAFVWLYGIDGTLKPTVYMNGIVAAQGADIAGSVNSTDYYFWDVIVDDETVTFICQSSAGVIVSEQALNINAGDPRFAASPYWFQFARCYMPGAGGGAATQLYVADSTAVALDADQGKPWPDIMAGSGMGSLVYGNTALTQLANYSNSAAPASATLSNTAGGYTTLGGQFQFAAVAGAETDYALFAFAVPAGLNLNVTEITIDTMNTGAAVATTATWLQWFCGEAAGATLASSSFRQALGNQVFAIADAIGKQANVIREVFRTPLFVASGRTFHIGLKMPLGTATASQVIRGIVRVNSYSD